jgi:hypothetical protein
MGRARDRASADLNGQEFILDADADTSISADTDDQIDIKIAGADDFQFTANTFTAQSGSTIAAQALTATTITASGIIKTDDTTDATSTTDGSLQTDGGLSVAKDAVIGDDLLLLSDSASIKFGADSEITLTHDADQGLTIKHASSADNKMPLLTLAAGDNDISANDVLGQIRWIAPDEGTGTDAVTMAGNIQVVSEGDFAADNNAVYMSFATGLSGAATDKLFLNSAGNVGIGVVSPTSPLGANFKVLDINSGVWGGNINFSGNSGGYIGNRHSGNGGLGYYAASGQGHDFAVNGATTSVLNIDSNGHVTMPYQSAFSTYLNSAQNDIAANNSFVTVNFDTEVFDLNADYNTSTYTFTAPVTGKYQFNASVSLNNLDSSSNYAFISVSTSNRSYYNYIGANHMDQDDRVLLPISVLADLDASDTAKINILINTGTAQADIATGGVVSGFQGYLVC